MENDIESWCNDSFLFYKEDLNESIIKPIKKEISHLNSTLDKLSALRKELRDELPEAEDNFDLSISNLESAIKILQQLVDSFEEIE